LILAKIRLRNSKKRKNSDILKTISCFIYLKAICK
jgi:hypothetical protein